MNADMGIHLSTRAHADAVPIENGALLCQRAKRSIVAHREHYSMDGTFEYNQIEYHSDIVHRFHSCTQHLLQIQVRKPRSRHWTGRKYYIPMPSWNAFSWQFIDGVSN